ncbi:MAG: tRNA 2-thiouridine(34) synthase MnmA [Ruminiclostridium sp.]|nr:tRNA 2-thiouridine(34) synthase MnmA [Ruminiclostridium sp.]
MKKVMVAMSGGVDSSAALVVLKDKYELIGVTLKLHDGEYEQNGQKTCCSLSDIEDARIVASRFDIMHYVYNFKDIFNEKVIKNFIDSYERCLTPNPCIDCNRYIKFEGLLERAVALDCDYIATGHYARIEFDEEKGRWLLKKANSEEGENDKDQSYVLYNLTQDQLSHVLFPLGSMKKSEVRRIAEENGLINAAKPDSQDICFVPDGNYAYFIEKSTGRKSPAGDVVNSEGKVVGRHDGLINYTIGQRKGLGIAFGKPTYVIGKNSSDNTLVVGSEQELLKKSLIADDLNWISIPELTEPIICKAKTRYRMQEQPCVVYPEPDGRVYVEFNEPQRAITPGQRVVFYDGDIVIGGGVIAE